MRREPLTTAVLQKRIDAAMGRIPCDTVLKNCQYLDVFSCEWRSADVGIVDGSIVAVDEGIKGTRTADLKNKWVVPGFIDAHVHVESSLMVPSHFQGLTLPKGTTSVICDPHELTNVQGIPGLQYFLSESERMTQDMFVMLSSCVPATHLETNGGGTLFAKDLMAFINHPKALGLAEMMNVPGVLMKAPEVLDKLEAFSLYPIDGHSPLLRGRELSAYLSTGISTCHESTQLEEAREKLIKGMKVWIREGSVAKDLEALIPLLNVATSPSIGFCTDDRNPLDIYSEGHLDFLVRGAIGAGVPEAVAYRSASLSVARHYGLNHLGAVAPGFQADLVILDDARTCAIDTVLKKGTPTEELALQKTVVGAVPNSIHCEIPEATDLNGPEGKVHVIGVNPGKIITEHLTMAHNAEGVARLSVLERYGKKLKPANGYVFGFGKTFRGAIASSVGHDSHNLIVVGRHAEDMRTALAALKTSGGGFVVVEYGNVLAHLPLPFGGLMTNETPDHIVKKLRELREASKQIGCEMPEPFLQLAFLSLPVIPSLKLTDRGLVDVEKFQIIDVRAA